MGDKNPSGFVRGGNEPLQQQQQQSDGYSSPNDHLRSPEAARSAALRRLPAELRERAKQQS